MTVRNRKFLRKFVSVHLPPPRLSITDDLRIVRYRKTSADQDKPTTTPPHFEDRATPFDLPSRPNRPEASPTVGPETTEPITPSPPFPTKRAPLALRRLMDFNSKGLKE